MARRTSVAGQTKIRSEHSRLRKNVIRYFNQYWAGLPTVSLAIVNLIVLPLFSYSYEVSDRGRLQTLIVVQFCITLIFTLELVAKIYGLGLLGAFKD